LPAWWTGVEGVARSCDGLSVEKEVAEVGADVDAGSITGPVEEAGSLPLYWRRDEDGVDKSDVPLGEGCRWVLLRRGVRLLKSGPGSDGEGVRVVLVVDGVVLEVDRVAAFLRSSFSFLNRRTRFHILTFSDPSLVASKHSLFLSAKTSSSARVASWLALISASASDSG
jgi:hypothetical protein